MPGRMNSMCKWPCGRGKPDKYKGLTQGLGGWGWEGRGCWGTALFKGSNRLTSPPMPLMTHNRCLLWRVRQRGNDFPGAHDL